MSYTSAMIIGVFLKRFRTWNWGHIGVSIAAQLCSLSYALVVNAFISNIYICIRTLISYFVNYSQINSSLNDMFDVFG